MNPYAPPAPPPAPQMAALPAPHGGAVVLAFDRTAHKPTLRKWVLISELAHNAIVVVWVFLAVGMAIFSFMKAAQRSSGNVSPDELGLVVGIGFGLTLPLLLIAAIARQVLSLMWMYNAWKWLPANERWTNRWKNMSPGNVVIFSFIPYFNLYWMFYTQFALSEAYSRVRGYAGVRAEVPRKLAMDYLLLIFVPLVNLALIPFAHHRIMKAVDEFQAEAMRVATVAWPSSPS